VNRPQEHHAHETLEDPDGLGRVWVISIVTFVLGCVIAILTLTGHPHVEITDVAMPPAGSGLQVEPDVPGSISVPPPPFQTDEALDSLEETGKPCSGCHDEDLPPNPVRRELDTHDDIVLHHDEKHRWCLSCHDAENRDKLRLAGGTLIDFTESYRLCGQCHGDKYRDWRLGIHGRRVGHWNGKKEYLLCVHCHYSHAPHFKPLEPKPRPRRPEEIK